MLLRDRVFDSAASAIVAARHAGWTRRSDPGLIEGQIWGRLGRTIRLDRNGRHWVWAEIRERSN